MGRRPGEKIHEELFNPGERPQPTHAEKIVSAVQPPLEAEWVESAFARIEELVYGGDAAGSRARWPSSPRNAPWRCPAGRSPLLTAERGYRSIDN